VPLLNLNINTMNGNSRRSEAIGGSYLKNPTKFYAEWNSEKKAFFYYDRDKKENVELKLPLQLVYLDERQTVGGWSSSEECSIYANEVKFLGKEDLTVKASKSNTVIAKGLYKDIKEKILAAGAKYYRSIYFLWEGRLLNIKVKGSSTAAWGDFATKSKNRFLTNYIVIDGFESKKSGGIKYTVPVFTIGGEITNADEVDAGAEPLYEYFDQKKTAGVDYNNNEGIHASIEEQVAEPVLVDDEGDLPF
jgi:hypothetical protein